MAVQDKISATELQKYLKDAEYPMERDALVILAEGNGAPEEVLDILEGMPDVDFESVIDVEEAFSEGKERHTHKNQSSQPRNEGQKRSRKREIEERKRQLKGETGKLTEPGKTVTGEPDHRLKGQETEAIRSARHMEHGYDGRGQITNPDMDARLAENRAHPDGEEAKAEPPKENRKRPTWKEHFRR